MRRAGFGRKEMVFLIAPGFGLALGCHAFGSSGASAVADGGGAAVDGGVAPDGALVFDNAGAGGCDVWAPSNGRVDVEGDAGSWSCRFCVSPGQASGAAIRTFTIPPVSGLSIYRGEVVAADDPPDSGISVHLEVDITPDGGGEDSATVPLSDAFMGLQVETPPLGSSETGGTMKLITSGPGCFRFDHATLLRYVP
jgi:hypothetical protein